MLGSFKDTFSSKEFKIVSLLVLDTAFFLVEAIVGYSVNSLALIADSYHMLNDIISLIIAYLAVRVKKNKPADSLYTYGWQRAEILGALMNAVFLLALCFTIIVEAIQRLVTPPDIDNPKLVLVVGFAGLASNIIGLALFHEHGHSHSHGSSSGSSHSHSHGSDADHLEERHRSSSNVSEYLPENVVQRYGETTPLVNGHGQMKKQKSLNAEGVFLHVLGDALGNVGVIVAALIIWKTDYSWRFYSDPFISLIITVIIFSTALPLCRKSSKILLQATPPNVDPNQILKEITQVQSVNSVHDFHVWNLNEDILIASMHLELNCQGVDPKDPVIHQREFLDVVKPVRKILHKYNIHSVTIQPEFYNIQPVPYGTDTYKQAISCVCCSDGETLV